LLEAKRVVKHGGVIAIMRTPIRPIEVCELCVTDDEQANPVVVYTVRTADPIAGRRFHIYLKPESRIAQKVRNTILNQEFPPTITTSEILELFKKSQFDMVKQVDYFCVYCFNSQQLRTLLLDVGFKEIEFWELPSATKFARALQDEGLLKELRNEQFIPYLRALVRSCSRTSEVEDNPVTAVNEK
jgi:hypothetical protein